MKKKLLIIGIAVLILAMVPAAALNLFKDRGENSKSNQQDLEIVQEEDQEAVAANPGDEENDRDEEPKESDRDDTSDDPDRDQEQDSKDQDTEGDTEGNTEEDTERNTEEDTERNTEEQDSKSTDNKETESTTKDKDEGEDNNKDKEGNKNPEESDQEEEKIVWGELGFSDTLDAFLQDTKGNLTRRNLAKLSVLFYEQISGNEAVAAWEDTFEDTKNSWVLKAYNLEIIPDTENGKFAPDRRITREEGAYTFYRTLRALDRPYPNEDFDLIGKDVESIGNWAYEAMAFMDYYEILPRRDNNKLDPGKEITSGEIKALWNNTKQWMDSYEQFSDKIKAPTGVFAKEDQGEAIIGWNDAEDAEYYYVYESLSKDGPFHVFNDQNGRPLKINWDPDYSLKVTGLTEGQTYYYQVRSVVDGIRSSKSEIVKVTATKSQTQNFEDYEQYLMKNYGHFEIGNKVLEFESIEITRGAEEDSLNLRYYLDSENSTKLRRLIRDGYREDIRTLFGYIIRETGDFYEKDIKAYLIYQAYDLEEYPKQYQDNRIESDPIGKDGDGTYFVWFPYLEMMWDFEKGEFTHRWFYENEGA